MTGVMLVSADAGESTRREVADSLRPRPEFLGIEQCGLKLLDWSQVPGRRGGRSLPGSIRHVMTALRRYPDASVFFSDGEHAGIPLAVGLRLLRRPAAHLMIGHHITTGVKRSAYRALRVDPWITRILVHSERQRELACRRLGVSAAKVHVIPYGVDVDFWRPLAEPEEALVFSPGREHRDHRSLAAAVAGLPETVVVTRGSAHSPGSRMREPVNWPANVQLRWLDYLELRNLYQGARLVVIPLLEADFPAGVTTLFEAMAMGKATVVSATAGLRDWVVDGQTAILVPPGDPAALASAIRFLLARPDERRRIGRNARQAVSEEWSTSAYVARLASHLDAIHPQPAGAMR